MQLIESLQMSGLELITDEWKEAFPMTSCSYATRFSRINEPIRSVSTNGAEH